MLLAAGVSVRAQPGPPRPVIPGAAATPAAAGQTFSLNLMEAPGGVVVELTDFVRMLESLYPGARSRWDAQRGMVRIEVNGHRFDALTGQSIVILDGKIQNTSRPLLVRQDHILLPVESVQAMLKGLNLDFELQTKGSQAAAAATPVATPAGTAAVAPPLTATPVATPAGGAVLPGAAAVASPAVALPAAAATPFAAATPTPGATPVAAPAAANDGAAPSINLAVLVGEKPVETPVFTRAGNQILEAPAGIKPQTGLTWKQLADRRHRIPPERIVIVCDAALEGVANGVKERLNKQPTYQAQTIVAPSTRRDQESLRKQIDAAEPELLIDLMAQPDGAENNSAPGLTVWTVHSALWPNDRDITANGGGSGSGSGGDSSGDAGSAKGSGEDTSHRYKAHEFQNLAVGSLLRGELAKQFPDRTLVYELAPSYLLRRTDAPSAAALIPVTTDGAGRKPALDEEKLADAIAGAAIDYADGIRGAN